MKLRHIDRCGIFRNHIRQLKVLVQCLRTLTLRQLELCWQMLLACFLVRWLLLGPLWRHRVVALSLSVGQNRLVYILDSAW